MLGYIGFALFIAAWYITAILMRRHGAGAFRRHIMGFCAAMLAGVAYIAVIGDAPKPPDQITANTQAAQSASGERPAAKPANAAEWAQIQKFAQSVWAIGNRHQAQKKREAATALAAKKLDLQGVRKAQVVYLHQLDNAMTALKQTMKPEVADQDGKKFIAAAYDNLNGMLLLSQKQTEAVVNAIDDPDRATPEQELVDMNSAINFKTALMVMSLHRLYWNYGFDNEDIDEESFAIKPSAHPHATVSFNRGGS